MPRISINTSQRKEHLRFVSNELEFYTVRVEPEIHGKLGRLRLFGWRILQIGQNWSIVVTCSVFITRNWSHKLRNWSVLHHSEAWCLLPLSCIASKWHRPVPCTRWKLQNFTAFLGLSSCIKTGSGIFKEEHHIRKMLILGRISHKKHSFPVANWLHAPWRWRESVEKCRSVIICEIIEYLLVLARNERTHKEHLCRKLCT